MGTRRLSGTSISSEQRRQMIAEAAYFRAEQGGFGGDQLNDWLLAEAEIDRMLLQDSRAKDSLLKRLEEQFSEWEERFDEVSTAAKQTGTKLNKEIHHQIEALHAKRATAQEKIAQLREHGAEAWDEWRDSAEHLLDELRASISKITTRLKKPGKDESAGAARKK